MDAKNDRTKNILADIRYPHPGRMEFMYPVCIIPTCVLFESVTKALKGNKKTKRELEKIILNSKGVLNEL
jgi:hypothetical protein